jgi:hypothetical protein
MELQEYKPQYVLDVILYDDSFYTVDSNGYEALKRTLNKEKFVELKGDLVATSSIKKVVKRALKPSSNPAEYYNNLAKQGKKVSKETLERFRSRVIN